MQPCTTGVTVMILCALWAAYEVDAHHAPDHRYTIWGYINGADGTPLENILVVVTDSHSDGLGTGDLDDGG